MDLSLVSIEDLVDEIGKRNDGVLVCTYQKLDREEDDAIFWFRGGKLIAVGLAEYAKKELLASVDYAEVDITEDEDE